MAWSCNAHLKPAVGGEQGPGAAHALPGSVPGSSLQLWAEKLKQHPEVAVLSLAGGPCI